MITQHFMLTVYSDFYDGYSVHAESDLVNTRFYLTLGADTHPRLFLDELQNVEFENKVYEEGLEEFLKSLITPDVERDYMIVNESYPAD